MSTYTEMEAVIQTELRQMAKELDQLDAEDAAAEAEFKAKLKAAPAEAKAKITAQSAEIRSKNENARRALNERIGGQIEKWDAEIDRLNAQITEAKGKAKSDLEARRSAARAHREAAQANLHASLTSQLNHFRTWIDELEAQAASANAEARAKITAQVAMMRKQVDAVQQEQERLKETRGASWKEQKAQVDRSMAELMEGYYKTIAAFHEGVAEASHPAL